jgi:hypothetical protein
VQKAIPPLILLLTFPASALAHGGGLDSDGCHYDRKRGGYHCHRGEFAGQDFASRSEMLKEKRAPAQADDGADKAKGKAKRKK